MAISGPGTFDNDDAISLLMGLEHSNSLKSVYESVDAVFHLKDIDVYFPVDYAAEVIAAGEVIALLEGKPGSELPERLVQWSKGRQFSIEPEFIKRCIEAIEMVFEESELRDLLSSYEADLITWQNNVLDLLDRLKAIIHQ